MNSCVYASESFHSAFSGPLKNVVGLYLTLSYVTFPATPHRLSRLQVPADKEEEEAASHKRQASGFWSIRSPRGQQRSVTLLWTHARLPPGSNANACLQRRSVRHESGRLQWPGHGQRQWPGQLWESGRLRRTELPNRQPQCPLPRVGSGFLFTYF